MSNTCSARSNTPDITRESTTMKTEPRILAVTAFILSTTACLVAADGKNEDSPLNNSEQVAMEYLDSFQQTGIPTPNAIEAAFKTARQTPSVENWETAAKMANSFANVVDVLADHYSGLYYRSRSGYSDGNFTYLTSGEAYEVTRNKYLALRNDAYIELAKIYLAKGEKAKSLSFAVTAVKLSGSSPNTEGEQLIRKIIEYQK